MTDRGVGEMMKFNQAFSAYDSYYAQPEMSL